MEGPIIWWKSEPQRGERGGQGIVAVTQDGIVQKYFLTRSKISRSPVEIKAGLIAKFEKFAPAPKVGFLPIALAVEIFPADAEALTPTAPAAPAAAKGVA